MAKQAAEGARKSQAQSQAQMKLLPADPRLRIGVIAGDPLRMLGFQALFQGHIVIAVVPVEELDHLDTLELDLVLIAAQNTSQIFETLRDVRSAWPAMRLIVMAAHEEPEFIERVLRVGAHGYLTATAAVAEMEDAIAHVYEGRSWTPSDAAKQPAHSAATVPSPIASSKAEIYSERELQVLDLLHSGQSNREIAASLHIEERTVKSHVARLLKKMGVKNRTALIMQAIGQNLVGGSHS